MCLIAFSYKNDPRYDLVFLANRDEFYERPTRAAQFWENYPHLVAGKDLVAGGTWMGITRNGYFSALTNYRDPSTFKEDPPSRGHLVLNYLVEENDPEFYIKNVISVSDQYNGFNLLAGNLDELVYYTNQKENFSMLAPGLYGLSNHFLNTSWPKVEQAKTDLQNILDENNFSEEALFELLKQNQRAPDNKLPDTGIPKELERAVSPIFIQTEKYGTRSSTILLVDKKGRVTFEERRYKKGTKKVEESNRYEFEIGGSL